MQEHEDESNFPSRAEKRNSHPNSPNRSVAAIAVGVFGEILITAGVFVLLFIGWRFSIQGLILSGEQDSQSTTLSEGWNTTGSSTASTSGPTPATAAQDSKFVNPVVMSAPSLNTTFGVLYVPRFGPNYKKTIAEGVDLTSVLNRGGAGHFPETQMPGALGNFALAGHRDGWGSAFININELTLGDSIYVETQDGWYRYVFRNSEYVTPAGIGILTPVPQVEDAAAADSVLLLLSCNPVGIASERTVAYAVFDSWRPRSAGPPSEIAALAGAKS